MATSSIQLPTTNTRLQRSIPIVARRMGHITLGALIAFSWVPSIASANPVQPYPLAQVREQQIIGNEMASIAEINQDPAGYVGRAVTVVGTVVKTYGDGALLLEDPNLLSGARLLVGMPEKDMPASAVNPDVEPAEGDIPKAATPGTSDSVKLGDLMTHRLQFTGLIHALDKAAFEESRGVTLGDIASGPDQLILVADGIVDWSPSDVNATDLRSITADPLLLPAGHVAVKGAMGTVISNQAFTITDSDYLSKAEILVITREPLSQAGSIMAGPAAQGIPAVPNNGVLPVRDDRILVEGELRSDFNRNRFEQELGGLGASQATSNGIDPFDQWEGKPVVIADSIIPFSTNYVMPATPATGSKIPVAGTGDKITPVVGMPELGNILDNAETYFDQKVAVHGYVSDIYSNFAFQLRDDSRTPADEIMVLTSNPLSDDVRNAVSNSGSGQRIEVSGILVRYDREQVERATGLPMQFLPSEWGGKALLIADSVTLTRP